jgi:hypothetical protein
MSVDAQGGQIDDKTPPGGMNSRGSARNVATQMKCGGIAAYWHG